MSTQLRNVPDCTFQNELTQTINWDTGYFEAKRDHSQIVKDFHNNIKSMKLERATEIMNRDHNSMTKKYFGPKYIKY